MMENEEFVTGEIVPDKTERQLGAACILLQFLGYFTVVGGLIAPLILWLAKKDGSCFVDAVGRETVNFQISILIYMAICGALCLVLIGFALLPLVGLFHLILTIVAAIKAGDGIVYRYPLCIHFLHR